MDTLDTLPGIDECFFCLGPVRIATPGEVDVHLRNASPEYRAAVEAHGGTWYVCPRCGPESAIRWQEIDLG